jgi:hypothetical protein
MAQAYFEICKSPKGLLNEKNVDRNDKKHLNHLTKIADS